MKNYFFKIALAATLGLVMASILSCAPSAGEMYASNQGCIWNYRLQHSWLADAEYAEMVRKNAATETLSNPNCAKVLRESAQMNDNRKEEKGNHNDAKNYFDRGLAYFHKGDYDNAIADFNQAIKLDHNYANAYSGRGRVYSKKSDYDNAIADFNQSIRLEPNNAVSYYSRGLAYLRKGDYDDAITDYSQTIMLKPDYAEAYAWRGTVYLGKGDYDKAIADYSRAIKLKPDFEVARQGLEIARRKKEYGK